MDNRGDFEFVYVFFLLCFVKVFIWDLFGIFIMMGVEYYLVYRILFILELIGEFVGI